jgi:hypothetical protein
LPSKGFFIVTAQKDQIQLLIAEIDQALRLPTPKFPWQANAQTDQFRQILQQVRQKLQTLASAPPPVSPSEAQDVMQSVVQEMQQLRGDLVRPLHMEVSALTQQRNQLIREIRQLEAHKQTYLNERAIAPTETGASVEQLQQVRSHTDEMLGSMDTTLRVVFESLQRDITSYQDSLTQGLENLHTLGRQSEAVFSGLVSRLAEQLGRDASTYLRMAPPEGAPEKPEPQPVVEQPRPTIKSAEPAQVAMPYAGTELFPVPQPLDSIRTLTELLDQLTIEVEPTAAPVVVPAEPPGGEDTAFQMAAELRALFQATAQPETIAVSSAEDAYTAEEDLLPSGSSTNKPDFGLRLDETTLSQLTEDLSNLEDQSAGFHRTAPKAGQNSNSHSVFSLEDIDDLFIDDDRDAPEQSR